MAVYIILDVPKDLDLEFPKERRDHVSLDGVVCRDLTSAISQFKERLASNLTFEQTRGVDPEQDGPILPLTAQHTYLIDRWTAGQSDTLRIDSAEYAHILRAIR